MSSIYNILFKIYPTFLSNPAEEDEVSLSENEDEVSGNEKSAEERYSLVSESTATCKRKRTSNKIDPVVNMFLFHHVPVFLVSSHYFFLLL